MRDAADPGSSGWALDAITCVLIGGRPRNSRHTLRTADVKTEAESGVTQPYAKKLQALPGGHQKQEEARNEFPWAL